MDSLHPINYLEILVILAKRSYKIKYVLFSVLRLCGKSALNLEFNSNYEVITADDVKHPPLKFQSCILLLLVEIILVNFFSLVET